MKKTEKLKNIGKSCPGVYALVNHSKQKCYIGQTKNLKDRIACHVNTLDTGKHHCKELQEDYNKGDKNFFYRASFLDFNVRNLIQNIRL